MMKGSSLRWNTDQDSVTDESHDAMSKLVATRTTDGLSSMAKFASAAAAPTRLGLLSGGNSTVGKWIRTGAKVQATNAATKMRDAARLKALQRTPYTMILSRVKLLLDRLSMFKQADSSKGLAGAKGEAPAGATIIVQASRKLERLSQCQNLLPLPGWSVNAPSSVHENRLYVTGGASMHHRASMRSSSMSKRGGQKTIRTYPQTNRGGVVSERSLQDAADSAVKDIDAPRLGSANKSEGSKAEIAARAMAQMSHAVEDTGSPRLGSLCKSEGSKAEIAARAMAQMAHAVKDTELPRLSSACKSKGSSADVAARAMAQMSHWDHGPHSSSVQDAADSAVEGTDSPRLGSGCESGGADVAARVMAQMADPSFHVGMLAEDEKEMALEKLVPDDVRNQDEVMWAKMENYKKDQALYKIGDAADKFYILLSGHVEVWTHPPGHHKLRTTIASLKKGQSFGELSILNNETRSNCVTSSGNCSLITVDRHAFMDIYGSYFATMMFENERFFLKKVPMFKSVPEQETA
eukprot:gene16234-22400_t